MSSKRLGAQGCVLSLGSAKIETTQAKEVGQGPAAQLACISLSLRPWRQRQSRPRQVHRGEAAASKGQGSLFTV